MMIDFDTVLFDLDGTLLPIEIDEFLERYFTLLTDEFTDLAPPEEFIRFLYQATEKMLKNDGKKTNRQVFVEHFFKLIGVEDEDKVMKRFAHFYREKYPQLQKGIKIKPEAVKLVNLIKEQGFMMVIATNPLFPQSAIVERIKWAGLDSSDFSYITSYENMHYSKPDLNYYREILNKISREPEGCIMVGNDVQEDIIAGEIGMRTYLVEDFLIDRKEGDIKPDWRGTIAELYNYFESLF